MIMNFLKKVPAGMMIVPLLIGAILNTFCSSILQVGSLTTATFSNAGAATAMGIQLVCLGTTLRFNEIGSVFKRGGVLLISKFVIGAAIGIIVGKVFGMNGFFGLSALAIICAVTNSNGSVYLSLMQSYGDEVDCGAMALLSLNVFHTGCNGNFRTGKYPVTFNPCSNYTNHCWYDSWKS